MAGDLETRAERSDRITATFKKEIEAERRHGQLGLSVAIARTTIEYLTDIGHRLAELERTAFVYEGPHETGKTYRKGSFVTHQGSLWHANYTTATAPGDGQAWTLAVKRGRDAK